MSLIWTAYVALKPAKGAQKSKVAVFRIKVDFFRRKPATKLLCVKTFSGKGVYEVFTGLSSCAQMVGGGCRLLPEILGQIDQPIEKRRLQVDIRL